MLQVAREDHGRLVLMIIAALSEKLNLFGLKVQKGQSGLITTTLMYLFEMKLITQIVLFGEVQHF